MRDQLGTRPVEAQLEQRADDDAAADGDDDERRRAALALDQQEAADGNGQDDQDGDAAEGGDVAADPLDPRRAERVVEILRVAQQPDDRLVDRARLARDDLVRQLDDAPDAPGEEDQQHDERQLPRPAGAVALGLDTEKRHQAAKTTAYTEWGGPPNANPRARRLGRIESRHVPLLPQHVRGRLKNEGDPELEDWPEPEET